MEAFEKKDLLNNITQIREKLKIARAAYDSLTDEALIDSCIYEIISLNAKYRYYIKLAKENGLIAEGFEEKYLGGL